jgi:hypothetical protein
MIASMDSATLICTMQEMVAEQWLEKAKDMLQVLQPVGKMEKPDRPK